VLWPAGSAITFWLAITCSHQNPLEASNVLAYLSDLLENIVNIVNVHHLENCRCKSSLVKLTECDHVFHAFDPYHLFLCPCERLFSTEVLALG
jgi:hypothetical protein